MAEPDNDVSAEGGKTSEKSYWVVSPRDTKDGRKDIFFQVASPGCPSEQQVLKNQIERSLSTLRSIYPKSSDNKYDEAFAKLLALAQVGLVGLRPSTSIASAALESLHTEIVDREAGRIKNVYMLK